LYPKNEEVDLSADQKKALKQIAHAIYEEVKKDPSLKWRGRRQQNAVAHSPWCGWLTSSKGPAHMLLYQTGATEGLRAD